MVRLKFREALYVTLACPVSLVWTIVGGIAATYSYNAQYFPIWSQIAGGVEALPYNLANLLYRGLPSENWILALVFAWLLFFLGINLLDLVIRKIVNREQPNY